MACIWIYGNYPLLSDSKKDERVLVVAGHHWGLRLYGHHAVVRLCISTSVLSDENRVGYMCRPSSVERKALVAMDCRGVHLSGFGHLFPVP